MILFSRKKKTFFKKLLFTIGLFICLPLFLGQVLILFSSYHTMNRQNEDYNAIAAANIAESFYKQIDNFRQTAYGMTSYTIPQVSACMTSGFEGPNLYNLSEQLKIFSRSIPLTEQFGFFFPDTEVLVTSSCFYKLDTFCEFSSLYNKEKEDIIRSFFREPVGNSCRMIKLEGGSRGLNSGDRLFVTVPVKLDYSSVPNAFAFFILPAENLSNFLFRSTPFVNFEYAIFQADNKPLFASRTEYADILASEEFRQFLSSDQSSYIISKNPRTIAYKYADQQTDTSFITITHTTALEEKTQNFFSLMNITIIFNLILTVLLLGAIAYVNYNPVRRLMNKIPKNTEGKAESGRSEFEQLEQFIDQLDTENSNQGLVIMDYILNDILYGKSVNQADLERMVPRFRYHFFCAVSAVCAHPSASKSGEIAHAIEGISGCKIYITDIPYKECTLFICLSEKKFEADRICQLIREKTTEIAGIPIENIAAGSVVEKLDDISSSYFESQAELGKSGSGIPAEYPAAEIRRMEYQISGRKFAEIDETIEAVFRYIDSNRHNRGICRYTCYQVMTTFLNTCKKKGYPLPEQDVMQMINFNNPSELQKMLITMTEYIREIPEEPQKAVKDHTDIIQYVNENFTDSNICLNTVADEFGLSIYTVSRIFKTDTGVGFREYINSKRLELASKLLITTDDPVSLIAQKVGVDNPSHFANIFRSQYGINPSSFRDRI